MSMPWLRLWDRTLDLSKAQKLDGETFKGWMNLLMLANRQNSRGKLPSQDEIAFSLRTDHATVRTLISSLLSAKLVDKRGQDLYMHDWEAWQPNEKTNAERAREWRNRQNGQAHDERSLERTDERLDERTLSAPRAPEQNRTEEEQIKTPPNPRKRGKAAPVEFQEPAWLPEPEWSEFKAMRRVHPKVKCPETMKAIIRELEKFREMGQDIRAVLAYSTMGGHAGVFKQSTFGPNGWVNRDRNGKPSEGSPPSHQLAAEVTPAQQAAADKMIADGMRLVEEARIKRMKEKSS